MHKHREYWEFQVSYVFLKAFKSLVLPTHQYFFVYSFLRVLLTESLGEGLIFSDPFAG